MKFIAFMISCLIILSALAKAEEFTFENPVFANAKFIAGKSYRARLVNGDILSIQFEGKGPDALRQDSSKVESINVTMLIGDATIYADEIAEIIPVESYYKHNSHLFAMQTANPIQDNHYIGLGELLFVQGGFGYDIFSVQAGFSLVPGLSWQEQAKLLNVKATIFQDNNVLLPGSYSIAVGGNLTFVNDRNSIQHIYAAGSFLLERTTVTTMLFYKVGNADIYEATAGKYGSNIIRFNNGALGFGLGFDVRLFSRHDTRAIAELWCSDIMKPKASAGFLGIRLSTSRFSSDIGFAMFTAPALVPAVNFQWLPFR